RRRRQRKPGQDVVRNAGLPQLLGVLPPIRTAVRVRRRRSVSGRRRQPRRRVRRGFRRSRLDLLPDQRQARPLRHGAGRLLFRSCAEERKQRQRRRSRVGLPLRERWCIARGRGGGTRGRDLRRGGRRDGGDWNDLRRQEFDGREGRAWGRAAPE
ncbi:unnamed protein product, partial [Scytosiphon promiscuus]